MNFLSMDYFVTLAQERNFTRAAEKLHITQQTLSAHIAVLEKEAGSPLFLRRVPLELTYAGKVFLRYAQDIRKDVRALQQELNDAAQNEAGELRIGTAPLREKILLPGVIIRFLQQYPLIRFTLTEASNRVLQEKLLRGEIDLAIAGFPKTVPGIELIPYYEEEFVLLMSQKLLAQITAGNGYCQKDIPRRITADFPAVFRECPFLLNDKNSIAGQIAWDLFAENGFSPRIRIESDNMETLLELCAEGAGAMICSETLAGKTLDRSRFAEMELFRFADPVKFTISFGCRRELHRWSLLDSFIETALACKPESS